MGAHVGLRPSSRHTDSTMHGCRCVAAAVRRKKTWTSFAADDKNGLETCHSTKCQQPRSLVFDAVVSLRLSLLYTINAEVSNRSTDGEICYTR